MRRATAAALAFYCRTFPGVGRPTSRGRARPARRELRASARFGASLGLLVLEQWECDQGGITADLEAMKRVGIGGVLIMDVVERFAPPEGPATYMGPQWLDLYQFALGEAHRLGLEMNMTNGPGWCGSSDPSITPELSMQALVTTGTLVDGPAAFLWSLAAGPFHQPARTRMPYLQRWSPAVSSRMPRCSPTPSRSTASFPAARSSISPRR